MPFLYSMSLLGISFPSLSSSSALMSSVTTSRIVESTAGVSTSNSIKSSLVVYPERKLSTVHSQVLVIGIAIPLSVVVAFATMIIYQSLNVVTGLCCNGTKGKQEVPAATYINWSIRSVSPVDCIPTGKMRSLWATYRSWFDFQFAIADVPSPSMDRPPRG